MTNEYLNPPAAIYKDFYVPKLTFSLLRIKLAWQINHPTN
jgi:hypothetical protein